MKKGFIFRLIAIVLVVGLCSCKIGCETRNWQGDQVIPAEGGTVVWRPTCDVNVQIIPTFGMVSWGFIDSNDSCVESSYYVVDESQKIKGEGFEKITGEWYEVLASTNVVLVTFSPNDTPFKRRITIHCGDGAYELGPLVEVSQSPKSWN